MNLDEIAFLRDLGFRIRERRTARGAERLLRPLQAAVAWLAMAAVYSRVDRIVALTPQDAAFVRRAFPFFARKVAFAKYATAFVAMPGGWGTLDELMAERLPLLGERRLGGEARAHAQRLDPAAAVAHADRRLLDVPLDEPERRLDPARLEAAADAFEHVANTLQGIVIKNS